jgi:ABC-2 type transport system permease protein
MRWREPRALAACWRLGWSEAREQRVGLLGHAVLFVIVLAVFWALWSATPLHEISGAPSREALLWYLAVTEWITFIVGARYREIEREVANGSIESALLRPLPHGLVTLARWCGGCTYQAMMLALVGVAAAWALTGSGPPHGAVLPLVALSSMLALALVLLCHLQFGYAAVWFGSAGPVFWIWQKLLFVFGGLLMPLFLYPPLLRQVADLSPFAAMLAAPASLMFGGDGARFAAVALGQLAWLAVVGALTLLVGWRATARLLRGGS